MGKYKNISGGPLDLVVPGFEAQVEDGETVDIPDFQPDGVSPIIVPANRWEPVTDLEPQPAPAVISNEPAPAEPAPEPAPAPEPVPEPPKPVSSDPRER